ncbi:MAG TPA: PAS domain-containing sensor histidine kinase, partial [Kofleriaceae bacterium]|nr:PAS domain-containing sensor histidine kinase [Kofleriaceae bacterium]
TWNPGAQRIKGYAADEIIGRHFSTFYPKASIADGLCERELAGAVRDGRFEDEGWRVRKDGSLFWANVIITALYDGAGKHIGFGKITRDLTERRNAENDRVRLAQAEEALRLRDEFLSIAAHELRTPLGALQLQIDSLCAQSQTLDDRLRAKANRAARNAERLGELIAALLDVSRIATGRLTIAPRRCDLDNIVLDVLERMQELTAQAGCTVTTNIERGITGQWDPLRIGQVIANLISNSSRYAAKSPIDISVVREGDHAIVRVEDRGPGIPEDALERIFGRFERAASPRSYGGLGIGLYVARQIVLAHGGTIEARNRSAGGALLEIRLPIQDSV